MQLTELTKYIKYINILLIVFIQIIFNRFNKYFFIYFFILFFMLINKLYLIEILFFIIIVGFVYYFYNLNFIHFLIGLIFYLLIWSPVQYYKYYSGILVLNNFLNNNLLILGCDFNKNLSFLTSTKLNNYYYKTDNFNFFKPYYNDVIVTNFMFINNKNYIVYNIDKIIFIKQKLIVFFYFIILLYLAIFFFKKFILFKNNIVRCNIKIWKNYI